jgi:hypothetical protein
LATVGVAQTPDQTRSSIAVGVNAFANEEGLVYANFRAETRVRPEIRVALIGTGAPIRTMVNNAFNILYGGTDYELQGTYFVGRARSIEISLGVDAPNTPARTDIGLTFGAKQFLNSDGRLRPWLATYGRLGGDVVQIVEAGTRFAISRDVDGVFSGGLPVQGNNSIDRATRDNVRLGLFSAGIEYTNGLQTIAFAITNQLGWTTGMAATPALGGFPGATISYGVKF